MKLSIKRLVLISLLATILLVQEEILTFLPNIQLTFFLFILYSKILPLNQSILIIIIHVILDNLIYGGFNPIYIIFMLLGYLPIPLSLNSIFKKSNDNISLAFLSILFALIYSWVFVIPSCLIFKVSFFNYMKADILFEILLATSSFLSVLWLYNPCYKILVNLINNK